MVLMSQVSVAGNSYPGALEEFQKVWHKIFSDRYGQPNVLMRVAVSDLEEGACVSG